MSFSAIVNQPFTAKTKAEIEKEAYEAQRKAEQEAAAKAMDDVHLSIAVELENLKAKLVMKDGRIQSVDGISSIHVSLRDVHAHSSSSWRLGPKTGEKLEVQVGYSMKAHHYPRKKDGTFSWDKIAKQIKEDTDILNARAKNEADKNAKRNAGREEFRRIAEIHRADKSHPLEDYTSEVQLSETYGRATLSVGDYGQMWLTYKHGANFEKAIEALKAAGLI
jgi:hypothetical protein